MEFVDLSRQYEKSKDSIHNNIENVLRSSHFIMGSAVTKLEETLSKFVGVKHGIAVASGTDALLLSLISLEINPGDEVITSPFSFISSAEVILRLGATPVFVDVDSTTYNLDSKNLEKAISDKTKAILPVSLFGYCANFTEINKIASQYKLPVIEDGCQSFGAIHKGKYSCGQSTLGCTSFYPSKPLGGYGDGGMVFTDNDELAEKIKHLSQHGQDSLGNYTALGMNSRLDTLQAAILLAKWPQFETEIELRRSAARFYIQHLSHLPIAFPPMEFAPEHAFAQFTIEIENRNGLQGHLAKKNIPSAIYYKTPLHEEPLFKGLSTGPGTFPVAEHKSQIVLSLPIHPYITEHELEEVFMNIMSFMG